MAEKPRFARNRRILQETEQDLPGAPQSPLHIPSSLAHSRRNAVRHVNCLLNARSITKRLGTRQPDELHLLLWITDILTENLIQECLDWDKEDELDHCRGAERGIHLKKLVNTIKS